MPEWPPLILDYANGLLVSLFTKDGHDSCNSKKDFCQAFYEQRLKRWQMRPLTCEGWPCLLGRLQSSTAQRSPLRTIQVDKGIVILSNRTLIKQDDFDRFDSSGCLFVGADFLQLSCSENGELDLANLGPVTNLAQLGCDKQYRWMIVFWPVG